MQISQQDSKWAFSEMSEQMTTEWEIPILNFFGKHLSRQFWHKHKVIITPRSEKLSKLSQVLHAD